jgi:hypothetical protein
MGVDPFKLFAAMESSNCIFSRLDYRVYRPDWSFSPGTPKNTREPGKATENGIGAIS